MNSFVVYSVDKLRRDTFCFSSSKSNLIMPRYRVRKSSQDQINRTHRMSGESDGEYSWVEKHKVCRIIKMNLGTKIQKNAMKFSIRARQIIKLMIIFVLSRIESYRMSIIFKIRNWDFNILQIGTRLSDGDLVRIPLESPFIGRTHPKVRHRL